MSKQLNHSYEFGDFRLDATEHLLWHDEKPVPLTPKVFETLLLLVRRGGHLVEKDDLMKQIWADAVVEEANVARNIWTLRKALGDDEREHRYIETVPKLGYRFVAPVRELPSEAVDVLVRRQVRARIVTEEEDSSGCSRPSMVVGQRARTDWEVLTPNASAQSLLAPGAKASWWSKRNAVSLLIAVAVFVFVALLVATIISRRHLSEPAEAIDSIAVLPFVNVNNDPNTEYLSDGVSDSIINSLSRLPTLKVMSLNSVLRYKGKQIDPQAIGRELNVRAVLMGRLTKQGDSLVITAELVDVRDNRRLWGEQYNRKLSEILDVQDDISREISGRLRLRLAGEPPQLIKRHTSNAEAYQLYLKGRYFWNKRSEEGVRKGIEYLQQAIDADPLYSLAYAGLADCYIVLGAPLNALPPKEAFLKAKAAATKALEIDDTLAEAYATLGVVKQRFEWDPEGAAQDFRRAIELNPTYATAHQWYAINFEILGQPDAAIVEAQRAYELDPLSLIINARLGHNYYYARRYDQAIEQYKKTLELDPNFAIAHSRLGWAYAQKGMHREAVEEFLMAYTLSGESSETVAALKQAFTESGMRGYWRKALELEQEKAKHRYVSAYESAVLYARLDEKEQAFKWLEKAYEERSSGLVYLKVDPSLDSLRHDPRFADLLRRIHLA